MPDQEGSEVSFHGELKDTITNLNKVESIIDTSFGWPEGTISSVVKDFGERHPNAAYRAFKDALIDRISKLNPNLSVSPNALGITVSHQPNIVEDFYKEVGGELVPAAKLYNNNQSHKVSLSDSGITITTPEYELSISYDGGVKTGFSLLDFAGGILEAPIATVDIDMADDIFRTRIRLSQGDKTDHLGPFSSVALGSELYYTDGGSLSALAVYFVNNNKERCWGVFDIAGTNKLVRCKVGSARVEPEEVAGLFPRVTVEPHQVTVSRADHAHTYPSRVAYTRWPSKLGKEVKESFPLIISP